MYVGKVDGIEFEINVGAKGRGDGGVGATPGRGLPLGSRFRAGPFVYTPHGCCHKSPLE